MKISDVLWKAANEKLWGGNSGDSFLDTDLYSCDAVLHYAEIEMREFTSLDFLRQLGCETGSTSAFCDFEQGEEQQGARYLWLMFAYLVALDEGL